MKVCRKPMFCRILSYIWDSLWKTRLKLTYFIISYLNRTYLLQLMQFSSILSYKKYSLRDSSPPLIFYTSQGT